MTSRDWEGLLVVWEPRAGQGGEGGSGSGPLLRLLLERPALPRAGLSSPVAGTRAGVLCGDQASGPPALTSALPGEPWMPAS